MASPRIHLKHAIRISATVILLTVIVTALDTKKLVRVITGLDLGWLSVAIIFSVAFVGMRIVKWILLTRKNGLKAPTYEITRILLMSLALGIVTPGRIGEVVVVAPFPRESRAKAVMIYLYDRIGELCTVLLFSTPAAIIFLGPLGLAVTAPVVIGCAVTIILIEFRELRLRFCAVTRLDRIAKLDGVFSAEVRAPALYWIACCVTYFFSYALVVALIVGAGAEISSSGVVILPVVTLSNLIPITVGGLGVREGLAAAMALLTNLSPEVVAGAFFLSFVFTRFVAGIVGLVWVSASSARVEAPLRI